MISKLFHRRFMQWVFTGSLLIILPALLYGCFPGGKKEAPTGPTYYTFDYAPPAPAGSPLSPASLCVEKFLTTPSYRTDALVYAEDRYSRQQYVYHRWRSSPGDMVSAFLARDFRHANLFRAVFFNDCRPGSGYRIEGLVEEIFEQNRENQWVAVLGATVTLIDAAASDPTAAVMLQKTYRAETVCSGKTPRDIAAAMSEAMKEISMDVIQDIRPILKQTE